MNNLLQYVDEAFTLHSGGTSHFKLECDALTARDWTWAAEMAHKLVPQFGHVNGVPRGGLAFAQALEPYVRTTKWLESLIVDDVWTTGASLIEAMDKQQRIIGGNVHGVVLFARGPIEDQRVQALFYLNHQLEDA